MIKANNLIKTFTKDEKSESKGRFLKKKSTINKEFNAVDDISLTVKDGEIVGILGPNGAGKTTLLRMLSGLMKPSSGYVSMNIDGNDITDTDHIKRHIGYLSANTKLYDRFSPAEIMCMCAKLYGMSDDDITDRIKEIANILEMDEFIDNRIEKLSTGQIQRASIARCLVHDPDCYIFDEPTLGLDIISAQSIVEFMLTQKKKKKSIIYSTHYMEEAERLCDRILLIDAGKILCDESPQNLMEQTGADNMRDVFHTIVGK